MADKLNIGDLNKMQESVRDTTDLSKKLRDVFKDIDRVTDLTSNNFKNIINSANTNLNLAEKYLFAQRTTEVITAKINDLKSKSSYLDETSLGFKKQEISLQNRIARQNIELLESAINSGKIDTAEGIKRIESLKMQRLERAGELIILNQLNGVQNNVVQKLQTQLETIQSFTPELTRNLGLLSEFKNLTVESSKTTLTKDFGKLGEYFTKGVTPAKFLFDIIEKGFENFKAFDKASVDVRKHLGLLPGEAKNLEVLIKQIGMETMDLGISFDDVGKSIKALSDEFTSLIAQDKDLLKTTSVLAKQFGIAENISAKFLKTLGGISDKTTSSQQSMIGFAKKMAEASGVPLGKIMEDVANATDDVRIYVGASAVSLVKAAAAARMMGTDLTKAASSAEKLLQFETSITAELKASALLGQNVNFNYARQLAFNKNIIGANKEILKIAKQVNFNQLNPIQQKAFADAAGKSVGELQDMLTQEKNMQLVANSTNKDVRKRYEEYQKLMKLKEEDAKNEGKLAEQELLRKSNQEKLAQIQNKFNKLMSELAEPVMEITEALLDISIAIMPAVISTIKSGIFAASIITKTISKITTSLAAWVAKTEAFIGPLLRSQKILLSIGKLVIGTLGFFGKWLNPIGWVITAFMGLKSLMDGFKKYWDDSADWPTKMWTGLKLLSKAIIEAFLPFDIVKEKLDEWFFGKSPSKAGRLIMKGFSSIGPELQNSLTQPINNAYKDIENLTPPEVNVTNTTTNNLGDRFDNTLITTIQSGNQQLIAKIDQLMNMMANGGIAVNLDGQLLTRQLSTTAYRMGGFGQSTTLA